MHLLGKIGLGALSGILLFKVIRGAIAWKVSENMEVAMSGKIMNVDQQKIMVRTIVKMKNNDTNSLQFTHPQVKITTGKTVLVQTKKKKILYDLRPNSEMEFPVDLPVYWESLETLSNKFKQLLPQNTGTWQKGLWIVSNLNNILLQLDLKSTYFTWANGVPYQESTQITL